MRTAELVTKFLALSLPLRLLIGAVVGVIAGPGLVGFLSEYATYAYALRLGIRPPVEGIPYLSATVTAMTLVLSILAGTIFILSRFIAGLFAFVAILAIRWAREALSDHLHLGRAIVSMFAGKGLFAHIAEIQVPDPIETIKLLSPTNASIATVVTSFAFGVLSYFGALNDESIRINSGLFGSAIGIFTFIAMLTIWSRHAKWWVSLAAAIIFYCSSFYALFNLDIYSSFLRIVGYGGVPVVVTFEDDEVVELSLILRTSEFFIGYEGNSFLVSEIPIGRIKSIKYEINFN